MPLSPAALLHRANPAILTTSRTAPMLLIDSSAAAARPSLMHSRLSLAQADRLANPQLITNMLGYLGGLLWPPARSTSSYPKYQYSKPPTPTSIRLLELLPDFETTAAVRCRIVPAQVATSPEAQKELGEYDALSYTWGEGPNSKHIIIQSPSQVDGQDFESSMLVRPNLYAALQRLRLTEQSRMLWIDAVCINQDDIPERTSQVKLMRHVYANAQNVLVWLGDDDETKPELIEEAFRTARRFWAMFEEEPEKNTDDADTLVDRINSNVAGLVSGPDAQVAQTWSALTALFSRPWFSRVWVIQEIVLARQARILWGAHQLDWKVFHTLASSLKLSSLHLPLPFEFISDGIDKVSDMETLKNSYSGEPLEKVMFPMMSTRNQLASDPRDKYNAILGLLKPESAPEPEYELEANVLFRNIAFAHLSSSGLGLDFLAFVDGAPSPRRLQLPSWAPDWSQTGIPTPFMFTNPGYTACGTTEQNFTFNAAGTHLYVEGLVLDVVQELGTPYPFNAPYTGPLDERALRLQTRRQTKSWFDECAAIFRRSGAPAAAEAHDFWRTLACNQDMAARPLNFQDFEQFEAFCAFYRTDAYLAAVHRPDDAALAAQAAEAALFEQLAKRGAVGRAFFASTTGRVGWAPRHARAGDVVCLLLGVATPFVLRHDRRAGEYRVIGECYIHGFMDGEASDKGVATTIFTIV